LNDAAAQHNFTCRKSHHDLPRQTVAATCHNRHIDIAQRNIAKDAFAKNGTRFMCDLVAE
jgi:hypothetical protein